MSCADKFPVSSLSFSSPKFFANNFTKPLLGSFPPFNTRWVCPPLTCLHSKTPPSPTNFSSMGNKNKKKKNNTENIALTSILKSLDLANDIEDALDSFGDSLSPKAITMILKKQRNWERVIRAFNWFKSQESYVHNVIHYNVVLRVLGRAQQWDQLRLCWIEMAKNDVLPTNNTYCMLIDVYGKAGLAKESLLWIKHMRMRGFFPDEVTMSTVVRVLKELGEFDRADRFYKNWSSGRVDLDDLDLDSLTLDSSSFKQFLSTELFKIGGGILDSNEMSSLNVPPKPRLSTTYNTLIDMYGKAGRLKDAADVFGDMMKSGVAVDACTYNTMIFICGSHGNLLEAEALLVKMEEKRISPNTRTFNTFVSLYANAGNIDAALACYRGIREAGLLPDAVTYRSLLGALCANNMVQAVETVIDEMEKSSVSVDEHSLPGIVKMYINQGDVDKANVLLQKFLMNREPSSTTCAAIIDAFAEKGLWSEAENIFYRQKDMSGRKRDVVEYNVMIKAFGKANLYDKALSLFKEMRSQGVWANDSTYNSIIQMLSGADLGDQATDLIFEMLEMGFKPHCQTFSAVIGCYARLGQLSDVVAMYQEMLKAGVKPNEVVYGSIINGFAEHGSLDEALEYFHLMEESGIEANLVVLSTLLKSYCKVGNLEGVKAIYEKMKNIEGGLDLVACNSMITAFADLGLVSEAKLAFENLKEMGKANSISYGTMMYVYKDVGLMDEAIKMAEEMKLSGLLTDCVSYNKVLVCYAADRQFHKCGELLHEMVSQKISPNDGTFKVLLTILKKGGFPIEAVDQLEISYQEGKPYASQATLTALYSLLGMHTLALESAKAFLESKVEIDLDSFAYNVAIYVYASAGDVERALNIYMKMRDKRVEPDIVTYIYLVGCYGKAGMVEGVKQIHSRLEYGDIEESESLFKAIVDAYKLCNRRVSPEMKLTFKSSEDSEIESESESESESEGKYEIGSDAEYDYNSDGDF